jgi:hypothetical protein
MIAEWCPVGVTHMVTLLDMSTWSLGCKHRSLAIVSLAFNPWRLYVAVMGDTVDHAFMIDATTAELVFTEKHELDITSECDYAAK